MLKTKLLITMLVFAVSAALMPTFAKTPCEKCLQNPQECKIIAGGTCENCSSDAKTIEKKIVVLSPEENRGFLGVYTENKEGGVYLEKIVPDSPAEKAGMTDGMIITLIKGIKIKTKEELINVLKETKPKDTIEVVVKSDGKDKTLKVILAEAPRTEMIIKAGNPENIEKEMPMMPMMNCPECGYKMLAEKGMKFCPKCGKEMQMMPPTPPMFPKMPMEKEFFVMTPKETRGFIGIMTEEDDGKLVVKSIVPNSPAEKAGLKENDVIAEINETRVITPAELVDVLKTTKPGDIVHLKIMSGGIEKMVDVELGEVPLPSPQQMKMRVRIGKHNGGGAGYFGPGVSFFNYDPIDATLAPRGLEKLDKNQFTFVGGGWGQIGRIRIGGFGMAGIQSVSSDTLDVELGYGAGFFELGYTIANEKNFKLTPLFGIGGSGLSMKITSLLYHPTNLDEILLVPGGVAKVSKGGLSMFPGLAIDVPFGFAGISLKGGYMWTPMSSSWTLEDFGKINGPDLKLNGLFASLNVIFGGFDIPHK